MWMLMMLLESLHGVAREIFIAPHLGDLRARQLGMPVACVIIFTVAWFTGRWLATITRLQQYLVGGAWVLLTLVFEFSLGRALGSSWARLLSDYNPARGGLMLFGLAFLFVTPLLVARWRSREKPE
jgi:hypothetical protein